MLTILILAVIILNVYVTVTIIVYAIMTGVAIRTYLLLVITCTVTIAGIRIMIPIVRKGTIVRGVSAGTGIAKTTTAILGTGGGVIMVNLSRTHI